MSQSRKRYKRKRAAESDSASASSDEGRAATASSTGGTATVSDFRGEDRPLLAFIALSAAQCSVARSAEVVLDAVLTPPKESPPQPSQEEKKTATAEAGASAPPGLETVATAVPHTDLPARYAEVMALLHVHRLRCALRDLQDCPAHARRSFYTLLTEHLRALYAVIPEPLFLAIAVVVSNLLASTSEDALDKNNCHVLEVQLLHMVEVTQRELLRATKLLTVRSGTLTFRFHHDIPYM